VIPQTDINLFGINLFDINLFDLTAQEEMLPKVGSRVLPDVG
jgi:hypothetical protein